MDFNRIADKETKFKKDFVIKEFSELTEDKGEAIKTLICLDCNNREVAKITKVGKEILTQEATTDAQDSGLYEEFAKKCGLKKEDIIYTKSGLAAARGGNAHAKDDKSKHDTDAKFKAENGDNLAKAEEHPDDAGKPDGVKSHLQSIAHHLKELGSMGFGDKDVPDWVESKMAQAAASISEIAHFFDNDEMNKSGCQKCGCSPCKCGKDLKKCGEFMRKCSTKSSKATMLEKGDVVKVDFGAKKPDTPKKTEGETDFTEIEAKNKANQARMKEDRAKSNKSVTRSYRLKKSDLLKKAREILEKGDLINVDFKNKPAKTEEPADSPFEPEDQERLTRIKESMGKINDLMEQLKAQKGNQDD